MMSNRKPASDGSYAIGKGRPPVETRFKPGRSGNPKGRPKKKPNLIDELRKILNERMHAEISGVPRKITVRYALIHKVHELALGGEDWAIQLAHALMDDLPETPAKSVDPAAVREKVARLMNRLSQAKAEEGAP